MGSDEKLFPFLCVQLECKGITVYAKLISLTNKHCFLSHVYGTRNYADQSETFGVAFNYSVVLQIRVFLDILLLLKT